ncbi:hypothetical protein BH20ACT8_BH20ACT8_02190 [soil metagenome]
MGEWLPATAPPHVKYDTWNDRRQNLETYVVPRIGRVALQDLNAAHLHRLYGDLMRNGGPVGAVVCRRHPYAGSTRCSARRCETPSAGDGSSATPPTWRTRRR